MLIIKRKTYPYYSWINLQSFQSRKTYETRQVYKQKRAAALTEWREICAA